MIKLTIPAVLLSLAASLGLTVTAQAGDILATTVSYDSTDGYDYDTTFPPTTYQNIGTFTFTIPSGFNVARITISGTFGNGDVPNTALSDYYLGFGGDEEAVEVASCDSMSANCFSGQEGPYTWTATLTPTQMADLAPALAAGSIDFGYTWDSSPPAEPTPDPLAPTCFDDEYVYAGAATLDIATPEPATVVFCFSGLAGLVAFRRLRKL
jgi:hypothetical protein